MQLNEYQKQALTTCMPTCDNFAYMMLNLVGEVGELASKVAKQIRHGNMHIRRNNLVLTETATEMAAKEDLLYLSNEMKKEAGDILWQLSGLCHVMGWSLEDVATMNLKKLADRQKRNTIDGNGDNR